MSTEATFDDLRRALTRPGCAVCRLVARRGAKFLASYTYEHVNDVRLREQIRDARGFCLRHANDLLDQLDTLAVAITYRDILNTLVDELVQLPDGGAATSMGRLFHGGGPPTLREPAYCPACRAEDVAEARALDVAAEGLDDPRLIEALRDSDPLCLVHLRGVEARRPVPAAWRDRQLAGWRRLRDHLHAIIQKSDYRFQHDALTSAELDAIRSSVQAVIGFRKRPADDARDEVQKLRRGGTNARRAGEADA